MQAGSSLILHPLSFACQRQSAFSCIPIPGGVAVPGRLHDSRVCRWVCHTRSRPACWVVCQAAVPAKRSKARAPEPGKDVRMSARRG